MDFRHTTTARLDLDAISLGDLAELYALHADPAVWAHFPAGRHTSVEQTQAFITAMSPAWDRQGLGYWSARLREREADALAAGTLVGAGGCTATSTGAWNLYYRLAPPAQGRGLAGELGVAALRAAREVDHQRPVLASMLAANPASARLAQRLGMRQVYRGPERDDPNPRAVRLLYADRALSKDQHARFTSAY